MAFPSLSPGHVWMVDAEAFMKPLIHAEFMHEIWECLPFPPRTFHKLLVCPGNDLLHGADIPNVCPN